MTINECENVKVSVKFVKTKTDEVDDDKKGGKKAEIKTIEEELERGVGKKNGYIPNGWKSSRRLEGRAPSGWKLFQGRDAALMQSGLLETFTEDEYEYWSYKIHQCSHILLHEGKNLHQRWTGSKAKRNQACHAIHEDKDEKVGNRAETKIVDENIE